MKTALLSSLALTAVLFASCTKEKGRMEEYQAIQFDARINQQKATSSGSGLLSTSWSANDKIGIFMLDQGSNTVSGGHANRAYSYVGSAFTPDAGQEIYYPVSDSKVDFIAYYPFKAGSAIGTPFPISVASQTDLGAIDVLWVKSTNGTTGFNKSATALVPLAFDHKLSKIVINTSAGAGLSGTAGDWTSMAVKIKGMNSTAVLDLATGIVSGNTAPADIMPFVRSAGAKYEAIVLPETFTAAGAVQITFTIGADTYTWSSQANATFEAGKEYTYNITVSKTGVSLGAVTIVDWIAAPAETGIAL